MSVATRLSFQSGFFEYLAEIEQDRFNSLAEELAEDYRQSGNWKALRDSRNWRRLISRFTRKSVAQLSQPTAEQAEIKPPAPEPVEKNTPAGQKRTKGRKKPQEQPPQLSAAEQARQAWESAHLRSSLGLLDKDKTTLIAGVMPGVDATWLPILVDDDTVGWLTQEPLQGITDSIDLRFQEQQRTAIMLIAALGLLLAAVAAMLMARGLIAPIRRLTETTTRLADGDFSARVTSPEKLHPLDAIKKLGQGLAGGLANRRRKNTSKYPSRSAARSAANRPLRNAKTSGAVDTAMADWQGDELQILAKQLNHLAGVLERNEIARRTFMAEVAHDLRTPLAVLKGEIEALEDGVRQVTPESLASLRAEVELMGRLVDDIHTLSLADVGMLKYDMAVFDLIPCLASALYTCRERISARGLELDASLPEGSAPVRADAARLGQVFRNILENSLRYTDAGGTIQVRCHSDGTQVFVDVLDSAPAVPEEQLARLFERFHTGDAARNRESSGSGLGLAICRTLLEAQGGDIRALPSPLGGLWVRVQMPLADGDLR